MDIFQMTVENNVFYAKRNIVDSIYKQARLEGISVTFPQTNELFEGRLVSNPDLSVQDVVAINNLKRGWQFILDTLDYPVDLRYIRQINNVVGSTLIREPGALRTSDVSMGGTTWKPALPDYDAATSSIGDIMAQDSSDTERALDMMLYLMRAQLFYDGNKRTATLVANQILISKGRGLVTVPVERIAEFGEKLIRYYETGESGAVKGFLHEHCLDGTDRIRLAQSQEATPKPQPSFPRMGM